ncbi:hypothetical protein EYR40_006523 [Pleurotus pulmonarius]|nr:hypothetical protein EYR36_011142 [Pleurotus pulmonarius]KAF4599429.1 hypothetical protein EYR40_006523 [Pleurotus pulmonarius]
MSVPRFSTIPGVSSGGGVSIASLTLTLQKSQMENDRLRETIRELEDVVAELQAEKAARKRGKKGRASKTGSDGEQAADDPEKRLTSLAKRFILHQLWIPEASFAPRPPHPSSDPAYFGSRDQWTIGVSAELYEVIPSELHDLLSMTRTCGVFRGALGIQRVAITHTLKTYAPRIFATIDVPAAAFSGSEPKTRAESRELQELLKWDTDKVGYPALAPVLYPLQSNDRTQPFMNPVLPLILCVALFGPSSLTSRPASNSSGRKWEITRVTIGGICMAAVMARFLISEDPELSPVGAATSINYEEDFHKYRRLLHGYRASPSPVYWRKLVHFYQKITFADVPNSTTESDTDPNAYNANANDDEDFSRALQLAQTHYRDDDDDDDDDNDNDNVSIGHTARTSSSNVSNFGTSVASNAPPARRPSSPPLSYISDMGIERLRIGEIDDDSEFEAPLTPSTLTEYAHAHEGHIVGHAATQITPATTAPSHYGCTPDDMLTAVVAPARGRGRGTNRRVTTEPAVPATSIANQQGQNTGAAQRANDAPRRGRGRGTDRTEIEPIPLAARSDSQGRYEHGLDALVDGIATKRQPRVARGRGNGLNAVETPAQQQPRRASQRKTGKS